MVMAPVNKDKETTMAGLCETLRRAATVLDESAASLRACHTVRGQWSPHEGETRAIYDEHSQLAKTLRAAAKYHAANPLGGPAKLFDAVADSIRAGDSVDSAMRAFDLKWTGGVRKRRNVGGEARR